MDLGNRIKHYRIAKNLTQKQLGELSGVAEITIRQYETGKREPKIDQLRKIAEVLNVPVSVFIDELTEEQRIKRTWEWIQDNDEKRKELITEILKTHNYKIEEKDLRWLIITDYQGFSFYVSKSDFQEMTLRCDKDIRYNIEKLLDDSREVKK